MDMKLDMNVVLDEICTNSFLERNNQSSLGEVRFVEAIIQQFLLKDSIKESFYNLTYVNSFTVGSGYKLTTCS